jgi:Na+/proline symporter
MFVQSLPTGATGLVAAGLFAATMSSMDSGINACSAVFITDFYHRFRRGDRRFPLALSRWVSLACGALSMLAALHVDKLGSVFEIANKIINGLGSPLLALFVLGMFSRRANAVGVLCGGVLGLLGSAYVSLYVENLALHYYAVVNLAGTLVLGYTFSLVENRLRGAPAASQLAWTWRARRRLHPPPCAAD